MLGLNYSFMMAETIGQKGITGRKLESFRGKALEALEEMKRKRHPGLAFTELLWQDLSPVKEAAKKLREFENFLLLGIGGSALGPKCILEALSPFHNLKADAGPKVFIYDNADPATLQSILSTVDVKQTGINVISKSGGTSETVASFMILYEMLEKEKEKKWAGGPETGSYLRRTPKRATCGNSRRRACALCPSRPALAEGIPFCPRWGC